MESKAPKKDFPFTVPGFSPGRKKKQPEALPGIPYASFNRRMLAAMLDSILVMLLLAPPMEMIVWSVYGPIQFDIAGVMQQVQTAPPSEAQAIWTEELRRSGIVDRWLFSSLVQTGVLGLVTILFWDYFLATPGKMLLRMVVADATTLRPITNRQSLIRFFGYFVSTLPLMAGFFAISFHKKRQAWHDRMANTVVIILPKGKKLEDIQPPATV